jgi:solute carrier family 35 protein E1
MLVKIMHPFLLTFLQLLVSIPCGYAVLLYQGASADTSMHTVGIKGSPAPKVWLLQKAQMNRDCWYVTAAFTLGFITLNLSYSFISVPLAMALRAAEPLLSVMVNYGVFGSVPTQQEVLAILIIVGGVMACTAATGGLSWVGLLLVLASNFCFAVRSVLGKRVQSVADFTSPGMALFFHVCCRGATLQFLVVIAHLAYIGFDMGFLTVLLAPGVWFDVIVNGMCYFTYLAFSFLILARVGAVTHTVLNAMRRPAAIIISCFHLGTTVNSQTAVGIAVACIGSTLYSKAKMS